MSATSAARVRDLTLVDCPWLVVIYKLHRTWKVHVVIIVIIIIEDNAVHVFRYRP
jgi:hypothetical protein